MTPRASLLIDEAARRHYVSRDRILSGKRESRHITAARLDVIRRLREAGYSQYRIGQQIGISQQSVSSLMKRHAV